MRVPMYVAAGIALAAAAPELARTLLASATSVLLECLPYLAMSAVLAPVVGRFAHTFGALAGCGCGRAPGALSLPAALVTLSLFGPLVAVARFAAGIIAWRFVHDETVRETSLLAEIERLVPTAVACALVATVLPVTHYTLAPPWVLFLGGAIAGAFATPCALGGIALAASLHPNAPLAAYGILCTTGFPISFSHLRARLSPFFTARHSFIRASHSHWLRQRSSARTAALSGAMLASVVVGAPQPTYFANETTMGDLYPGERLSFTGSYVRGAIVRYAITCCRADAAPVTVRLSRPLRVSDGTWISASGEVVREGAALDLEIKTARRISPPTDPFLYR